MKTINYFGICTALLLSSSLVYGQNTTDVPTTDASQVSVAQKEIVSTPASFPGGNQLINKFIASNVQYPKEAINQGIEGKVLVGFVVERDGSIQNVVCKNKTHETIEQEAIRVIKSMPTWTPATADGKPIKTVYTIPINFKLQE